MIPQPQAAAQKCLESPEFASKSRIPVVPLNVDVLTDTVASRLMTSLLGHVLYLKNQIPLPIVQLARMTNRKGNTKAAKMKADLLTSFDTLASHLVTTFSALSTALSNAKASSPSADDLNVSRAYMAILVGPSLGTAKSKVIYGVDNLVTRVWGARDDEEEVDEESGGEEYPEDSEEEEEDDSGSSGGTKSEEEEDTPEDDDGDNAEGLQGEEDSTDEAEEGEEPTKQENDPHKPSPPPQLHQSYAEEQRFLHTADRLLAQVLALADAEGHGISNEMSPSQIHILLRAPRRFVHPAWAPRQNIQKQMEATLTDFINESWPLQGNDGLPKKKRKPVEGVWVTGKDGLRGPPVSLNEEINVPEENEMIWWSWDGKLVGFADW